jgi:sugar lactone lactonase YvrE
LQLVRAGKIPATLGRGDEGRRNTVLTAVLGGVVLVAAAAVVWAILNKPAPVVETSPATNPPVQVLPAKNSQPTNPPTAPKPASTGPLATAPTNPPPLTVLATNSATTHSAATNMPPAIDPASIMVVLAGQPGVPSYADGPGAQARFFLPNAAAVDGEGNLYVADTANHVIRLIKPNGMVSTLAGLAGTADSNNGVGANARFSAPFGVAVDATGNVYVADSGNNTIRKITPAGAVSTLAGLAGHPGSDDGPGSAARFRNPRGVAVDAAGNVYVADMSNYCIRKITPDGGVTTLAGKTGEPGNADGVGSNAQFCNPYAVVADAVGNVYVADGANNTIRKVTPKGTVITVAGLPGYAGNIDGNADAARFSNPEGLALDAAGNVYVADSGNNAIRKLTPDGEVITLAPLATSTNTIAELANREIPLKSPDGVAVDKAGNIYIVDTDNQCIRKLAVRTPP